MAGICACLIRLLPIVLPTSNHDSSLHHPPPFVSSPLFPSLVSFSPVLRIIVEALSTCPRDRFPPRFKGSRHTGRRASCERGLEVRLSGLLSTSSFCPPNGISPQILADLTWNRDSFVQSLPLVATQCVRRPCRGSGLPPTCVNQVGAGAVTVCRSARSGVDTRLLPGRGRVVGVHDTILTCASRSRGDRSHSSILA